jgi:hypothetical protein
VGRELAVAMETWAPVIKSQRSMVVLYAMSLRAYDKPWGDRRPDIYEYGHRPLAQALGYIDINRLETEPTPSQENEIRIAIKRLIDAGAVELIRRGIQGRASEYRLIRRPMGKAPP